MTPGSAPQPEPLLTPRQAAAWLGMSRQSLDRRIRRGDGPPYIALPGMRRCLRFRRRELERWLAEHEVVT